jgi:hypothetical protein
MLHITSVVQGARHLQRRDQIILAGSNFCGPRGFVLAAVTSRSPPASGDCGIHTPVTCQERRFGPGPPLSFFALLECLFNLHFDGMKIFHAGATF